MKILMVLTSHDQLGNTGRPTGFWLEEFAAPYFVFRDAGVELTLASPKGGQPPLDPKHPSLPCGRGHVDGKVFIRGERHHKPPAFVQSVEPAVGGPSYAGTDIDHVHGMQGCGAAVSLSDLHMRKRSEIRLGARRKR